MRFYAVPLYSLVFCGFGAPPFMARWLALCFMCYHTLLLYTVSVPFWALKYMARFGSAYSVICRRRMSPYVAVCRRMSPYVVVICRPLCPCFCDSCPLCFHGYLLFRCDMMRYAMTCYDDMTILRYATVCLCDRERQSLYESIAFMFTSNASLMLFTSLFITSESVFKKH